MGQQKRFTKEFEGEAVRLALTSGRTRRSVAEDLAAILWIIANEKDPKVLLEVGVLGVLILPESMVAGTRNTRYLRLVERAIPRLAA